MLLTKTLTYYFTWFFLTALPVFAVCDETGSDSKRWTLQAREREATREERQRSYERMTLNERASISDIETYPSEVMVCGKGFSEGLAKISINGRVGFINQTGRIAIKANLRDAGRFSQGLAPFESKSGKWGYIDRKGEVVIAPRFDWGLPFEGDRALVALGEKWGFIDTKGKTVIEPKFDGARNFSEGLALVQIYVVGPLVPGDEKLQKRYKSGFVDRDGRWIIQPTWDGGSSFNGGMARVSRNIGYSNGVLSEDTFIDRTGKRLFQPNSWYLTSFSEDALVVALEDDREFTFIGRNGERLTDKTFSYLGHLREGLAEARTAELYGYVNRKGDYVVEPKFEWTMAFSEGLAGARENPGKCGYIDRSGEFVIIPSFQWCGAFREGIALVAEGYKTGYISQSGKYIWKPTK